MIGTGVDFIEVPALLRREGPVLPGGFPGGHIRTVDVVDQQAASADEGIPALVPAAFQQEQFAFVFRFQVEVIAVLLDGAEGMSPFRERPSGAHVEVPALHGAVVRGRPAAVVMVSAVHQVDVHPLGLGKAAAVLVVRIVQVRDAEGMGVLVAERADAGERGEGGPVAVHPQFRGTGVIVDEDPVARAGEFGSGMDIPLVRPDVAVSRPLGLVRAGIEDEDVVHDAVPVVVIGGKVDGIIHGRAGVDDHLGAVVVLALFIVAPVPGVFLRQGHDVGDVELEGVAVLPLVLEIGEGGTGVRAVDQPFEIVPAIGEFQVLELGQDDQPVADRAFRPFRECAPRPGQAARLKRCLGVLAGDFPLADQVAGHQAAGRDDAAGGIRLAGMHPGTESVAGGVEPGVAPPALRVLDQGAAVRRGHEMSVFVTGEIGLDRRSVRLQEVEQAPPGGTCLQKRKTQEEYGNGQQKAPLQVGFRFHTIQMTAFFGAFANLHAKNRPQRLGTDSLTCTKT